jgi:hypothetical protein
VRAAPYLVDTPAPRGLWLRLVETSPESMAFHSPRWVDAVCTAGGWRDASRLYTLGDGRRLLVPLVERGCGGVVELASMPYGWGFGGVVAESPVTADDTALVATDLASLGAIRASLRPNPLVLTSWPRDLPGRSTTIARTAHVLDLRGGFDHVWSKRFTGPARTAVRKAERQELEVQCDSTGRLLPVFHELYERSIERWNSGRLARWQARRRDRLSKFRAVVANAGQHSRIWVAWHQGRPAAAILTLSLGASTNYWRGAMDERLAGPTRANYLLHRLAIEEACRSGCSTYHMGETGSSASLAQFKTRFGARPVPYRELRLERLPLTQVESLTKSLAAAGRRSLQTSRGHA